MWKWETDGSAKGVIVIIHGALEHHRRYGWLIEKWRAAGFHIVMGDLPGHGMTSRSRRGHVDSFDEYIIEAKEWVTAAYQFDLPIFLIGHSMGGLIAIRLLQEARLNLAGAILSSPCLGLIHQPAKFLNVLSAGLNKIVPHLKFNSGITVEMATRNLDVIDVDKNDSLYVKKVSVRWYRELEEAMKLSFLQINQTQDLPMLVMQGGADLIVDKKQVIRWFNRVPLSEKRYKEWPNCYHEIFNEPEREEVFQYALDFVHGQLKAIGYIV